MGGILEIKLNKASVKQINDKIIEVDYVNYIDINLDEAKEVFNAILEIANGKKFVILLDDFKKSVNFDSEVKDFFSKGKDVLKANTAMAIVLSSVANKLIGRIFMNFHKPSYPVKIFSKREQAIEWLEKMYNEI